MSYNGIGLSTARGSGTNGYIQKNNTNSTNLTSYQRRQQSKKYSEPQKYKIIRHKDVELAHHDKKRELELKVSTFRDDLEEDDDLSDTEIEAKVKEYREKLIRKEKAREVQYVTRREREDKGKEKYRAADLSESKEKLDY